MKLSLKLILVSSIVFLIIVNIYSNYNSFVSREEYKRIVEALETSKLGLTALLM